VINKKEEKRNKFREKINKFKIKTINN